VFGKRAWSNGKNNTTWLSIYVSFSFLRQGELSRLTTGTVL